MRRVGKGARAVPPSLILGCEGFMHCMLSRPAATEIGENDKFMPHLTS